MVKINRIYTRTGDTGETGLVGGYRVAKDCPRVHAYGEVDELNAVLGLARSEADKIQFKEISSQLAIVQNELFDLGAELATPAGAEWQGMKKIELAETQRLEKWIDALIEGLPELRSFVLPGGSPLNAYLHLARTICRRAERSCISLSKAEQVSHTALVYLNRLSDYLFAAARRASAFTNTPEYLWQPGAKSS